MFEDCAKEKLVIDDKKITVPINIFLVILFIITLLILDSLTKIR
jgi:hypothetical protein